MPFSAKRPNFEHEGTKTKRRTSLFPLFAPVLKIIHALFGKASEFLSTRQPEIKEMNLDRFSVPSVCSCFTNHALFRARIWCGYTSKMRPQKLSTLRCHK